jgi:methyl-accepting chemotaxis protein
MEIPMTIHKRKRLNTNVKKTFQKWLYVRILGMIVLSSLIAALILYFYARNEITSSFFDAHIKIRRVSDLLLPVVIAGSMVSLVSGVVLALFLPQKIAGPIYNIENGLKRIQEGDLTTLITLREGDILTDLAREVNTATDEIHNTIQQSKDILSELILKMETTSEEGAIQKDAKNLQSTLNRLITRQQ